MPLNIPCLGLPGNRTEKIFKRSNISFRKDSNKLEIACTGRVLDPSSAHRWQNSAAAAGAPGKSTGAATRSAPEELHPDLRYFRTPNHWHYFSSKFSHCTCHFPMLPLVPCSSCSLRFKELSII